MTGQTLFSLGDVPDFNLEQTGDMNVAVDETFSTSARIQLDDTSWVDHAQDGSLGTASS